MNKVEISNYVNRNNGMRYYEWFVIAMLIVTSLMVLAYQRLLPIFIMIPIMLIWLGLEWNRYVLSPPQSVDISADGITFNYRKGKTRSYRWRDIEGIQVSKNPEKTVTEGGLKPFGDKLIIITWEMAQEINRLYMLEVGLPLPEYSHTGIRVFAQGHDWSEYEGRQSGDKNQVFDFELDKGHNLLLWGGPVLFLLLVFSSLGVFPGTIVYLFFVIMLVANIVVLIHMKFVRTPKTVIITEHGVKLIFKFGIREYSLRDIQWINVWPGSRNTIPYSTVKFNDHSILPKRISYDAGKALRKEILIRTGLRPKNLKEHLAETGGKVYFVSKLSE